jgi:hypothetical protein
MNRDMGPSTCPTCGNTRETVFAGPAMSCRDHPGHPLNPEPFDDTSRIELGRLLLRLAGVDR